jgi:putative transposase
VTAYRFIAAKKTAGAQGAQGHEDSVLASVPVRVLCRSLGVSPSGYYAWLERPASSRSVADTTLTATIQAIHATSRGTYGAPRVHAELTDPDGLYQVRCGRKRVARLMRLARIIGCHRRRARHTTIADPTAAPAEDLVKRAFAPAAIEAPDRLYVADITYVRTWEGWLYLAVVLDCFSRRVVGWAMADHLRTELVLEALGMAVWQRRPAQGVVHHSDHGCQYTSLAFGRELRESGLVPSMGSVADCFDNAVAESFFATLKCELLYRHHWPTRAAARAAIFDFLQPCYNRRRRHSTLGYHSPNGYEEIHRTQHTSLTT